MSRRQGIALSLAIVTVWSTYVGSLFGPWWGVGTWVGIWLAVAASLSLSSHAYLAAANVRLRLAKARHARARAEGRRAIAGIRQSLAAVGIDTSDMTDEQMQEAINLTADALAETGITHRDAAIGMVALVRATNERQGGRL